MMTCVFSDSHSGTQIEHSHSGAKTNLFRFLSGDATESTEVEAAAAEVAMLAVVAVA